MIVEVIRTFVACRKVQSLRHPKMLRPRDVRVEYCGCTFAHVLDDLLTTLFYSTANFSLLAEKPHYYGGICSL